MMEAFNELVGELNQQDPAFKYSTVLLIELAFSALLFFVVRKQTAGIVRLLLSLPLLGFNALVPLCFTYPQGVCTIAVVAFNFTWVGSFKVLGLCCNRGPLSSKSLTFPQFVAIALLPITPLLKPSTNKHTKINLLEGVGDSGQLFIRFCAKCVLLGLVVHLLTGYPLHPVVLTFMYGAGLYAFLGVLMDGPGTLLTTMIALKVAPHFNAPYLSHTVADFWGKRWNLTAGNTLRFLIYEPIVEGRVIKAPGESPSLTGKTLQRALGLLMCFCTSGLAHEIIWNYLVGHTTGWRWFAFFAIQGPVILIEVAVRSSMKKAGFPIPKWVTFMTTWTFIIAAGHVLFIPPCVEDGVADQVVYSVGQQYQQMQQVVEKLPEAFVAVYTHRTAP